MWDVHVPCMSMMCVQHVVIFSLACADGLHYHFVVLSMIQCAVVALVALAACVWCMQPALS